MAFSLAICISHLALIIHSGSRIQLDRSACLPIATQLPALENPPAALVLACAGESRPSEAFCI